MCKCVNLILTDPPYITSRKTGMNEHAKQIKAASESNTNIKTEQQWNDLKTTEGLGKMDDYT